MLLMRRANNLRRSRQKRITSKTYLIVVVIIIVALYNIFRIGKESVPSRKVLNSVQIGHWDDGSAEKRLKALGTPVRSAQLRPKKKLIQKEEEKTSSSKPKKNKQCAIHSLSQLSKSQIYPKAGKTRYIVDPPSSASEKETTISLVCCHSTAGSFSIIAHENWAPLGYQRFLDMVRAEYFSSKVPFMRCISNFLCQFGIAGESSVNKKFARKLLNDDPQWLPAGPKNRANKLGVKRFSKGFLAYAGAGANTRSNQLIVALADSGPLGGGSPWEVPWGEFIGEESFETLDKIYTGYGEKGPKQGELAKSGFSASIQKRFPKLDYISSCTIADTMSAGNTN